MRQRPRPLTQATKREQIKSRLLLAPELSDRAIARSVGCSHATVGVVRRELLEGGQIDHVETSDSAWLRHPYLLAHPSLLDGLNERGLRAIKAPGVLDLMSEKGLTSAIYAQRRLHKANKAIRKNVAGATLTADDVIIKQADTLNGLPWIEDESIDLIVTDPPYGREYLPLYTALSALAGRILRPGGSLLVMSGQAHLPEVLQRLCVDERIKYHWCLSVAMPRAAPPLHWKKVSAQWKPVVHLVKGVYTGELYSDYIMADRSVKERDHPWEQPQDVIDALIKRFVHRTGLTICDPMCGAGTTGIAAIRAGCRAVLSDVDPACVRLSQRRCMDALTALPTDA